MKTIYKIFLLITIFTSCGEPWVIENPGKDREVQGMEPIYIEFDVSNISSEEARAFFILENVVVFKEYILVVEKLQGVHVIDNNKPSNPTSMGFWKIPGIKNFTIDDEVLYVPLQDRLITIDITDINDIKVINVLDGFFQEYDNNEYPEDFSGSFECVDLSKGIVIGWKLTTLFDPNCWR